ncbi:RhoGAP domain-containing protein [Vibrio sp. AND4]|uniref:RhoGAP domain-containing protein n=1 Tax=Vibrio sp. AND4 TaxID=314289 RepID=UPI00015F0BCB|nr:RhoGAP domain-containing protein [Vibrio sp. AND4]EDP59234.1 hypothetical protein AND4_15780 [Vibrio sp. AND4]
MLRYGSTPVVSREVNTELKAKLEQPKNNSVRQEAHLNLSGKVQTVKLSETSSQAAEVGKGKMSRLITSISNFFGEISNAISQMFSRRTNKNEGANKAATASQEAAVSQEKTKVATAQNKDIFAVFDGNEGKLKEDGLMRLSGVTHQVNEVLQSTKKEDLENFPLHALTGAFKKNIREHLPAKDAAAISDLVTEYTNSKNLPPLTEMPEMAQDAINLAKQISAHSDENRMTPYNLGVVLGPNFDNSRVINLTRNAEFVAFFTEMISS